MKNICFHNLHHKEYSLCTEAEYGKQVICIDSMIMSWAKYNIPNCPMNETFWMNLVTAETYITDFQKIN